MRGGGFLSFPFALAKPGAIVMATVRKRNTVAKTVMENNAGKGQDGKRHGMLISVLIVVILALVGCLVYILVVGPGRMAGTQYAVDTDGAAGQPLQLDQSQSAYVKPETPVDRSKNITLPGWGGFTIPAQTTDITQGFEFHNPAENLWYEDVVSINGKQLEHLVVDSGTKVELSHYLKLAGIQGSVTEVADYDERCFAVERDKAGDYTLEGIGGFEGEKVIKVRTNTGKDTELSVTCAQDCYLMTFGLYLSSDDELLYQSDLVAPGNYIQRMEMTRALEPGTYDAYVVCQPYCSDGVTKTNSGIVRITLTVA